MPGICPRSAAYDRVPPRAYGRAGTLAAAGPSRDPHNRHSCPVRESMTRFPVTICIPAQSVRESTPGTLCAGSTHASQSHIRRSEHSIGQLPSVIGHGLSDRGIDQR
jgi:hypothetical protein